MRPVPLLLSLSIVLASCASRPTPAAGGTTAGGETAAMTERRDVEIRLCSWNVKKMGHGDSTDFALVAGVLEEHCDVSVIVEVMQRGGEHPGLEALMAELPGWSSVVTDSPRPNTSAGSAEFYAAIWRDDSGVTLCDGWTEGLVYVEDNDGGDAGEGEDHFAREPAVTCLEHRNDDGEVTTDFMLAAYHATWADGATAEIAAEVAHLTDLVDAMHAARDGELDLFIMGDFNLVPSRLAMAVHFADRTDGAGSTLNMAGEITANLYDHILVVDEEASAEVLGDAEVLDVRDVAANGAEFYRTVSDHLPIVVRVAVTGTDDD